MKTNNPVLVLFGPTASGKTRILLELFNSSNMAESVSAAEVVSADSMQVYKGMDIGTAKPSAEERKCLPHHLIDILNPAQQFNAGDFVRLANEACEEIVSRGKLPVVSGGTGFYLKNFIMGLSEAPPSNAEIRTALRKELQEKGASALMAELAEADPVSAGRIHINDEYRLLRALEVWRSCGKPLSSFEPNSLVSSGAKAQSAFNFIIIGLSRPREELYRRINQRCVEMFRQGLVEEVRSLFEAGYTPNDPGLRAIGYREFFIESEEEPGAAEDSRSEESGSLEGQKKWRLSQDVEGVQALVAQNSRRYAKRQITFFANIPGVKWIECGSVAETASQIKQILENVMYA